MAATVNIEVKAQVDDAVRGLGQLNKGFDLMKRANQDAAGALGVFGVSLTALNSPLTAIASGIKDSLDKTLSWANTIDKLSRATGMGAAETSKMAIIFEDFGIKADSLDKVIKTFTKNGLQFNMETIKKLAVEYQAIKDPIKQNEFAFKNFGRSALELTEILSKTPEELQAVGDAARYSGKVMDEQAVEAAQHFSLQLAQLGDNVDGLKIAIGERLIPTLSAASGALELLLTWDQRVTGATEDHATAVIKTSATYTDYITELDRAATAGGFVVENGNLLKITYDEFGGVQRKVIQNNYELTQTQYNEAKATGEAADKVAVYATALDVGTLSASTHASAIKAMSDANVKAQLTTEDLTKATQAQADQLLLTAGLSGTVTKAEDDYRGTIQGNQKDIDKLTTEIAKYEALQGTTITTVAKGSITQQDYNLAVEHAAIAHQRLAEYHGKSQASLMSLNLSVQQADDKVSAYASKLGAASTTTADYTTKIDEDQAALDKLNGSNADAAAAIAKTTGAFILQQETALIHDPTVLAQVAFRLGLIDTKSYNLAINIGTLTDQYNANVKAGMSVKEAGDILAKQLAGEQKIVEDDANRVQPAYQGALSTTGGTLHHAGDEAYYFADAINSIPTEHTTTINTIYGPGGPGYEGGGNGAGGGNGGSSGYNNPAARAGGGPVSGGMPYMVGENGPELFVPGQGGTVINNYNTSNIVNASYGGSPSPAAVAREMRLISKLNR